MKFRFFFFQFFFLFSCSHFQAQELRIRNVDETNFPRIKVLIEFSESKLIDFSQLNILELNDTLVYSIDSIQEYQKQKAVLIFIHPELIKTKKIKEKSLERLREITGILSEDDLINVSLYNENLEDRTGIFLTSYEFTNDFDGFISYLNQNLAVVSLSSQSSTTSQGIRNSIEFLSKKTSLPPHKLLLVLWPFAEKQQDSITELKKEAHHKGVAVFWLFEQINTSNSNTGIGTNQQLTDLSDSINNSKILIENWDKKLYQIDFITKQKEKLNQFEIDYQGVKIRSTFARPSYISFFKDNVILFGIIGFFLLLIIFFIVNLIYTKRQMMISVRDLKSDQRNDSSTGDIAIDNFSAKKTLYGTASITPFLTIETEGKTSTFELNKMLTKIGRNEENDIVIDNLTISSVHAIISIEGGQFYIKDISSTNGVYINEVKVTKAKLKNGDSIRLGKARLVLTQ